MVRAELTSTRTAGIDNNHSTSFTVLVLRIIRTQLYMWLWTKMDAVRRSPRWMQFEQVPISPSRAFASYGKMYIES